MTVRHLTIMETVALRFMYTLLTLTVASGIDTKMYNKKVEKGMSIIYNSTNVAGTFVDVSIHVCAELCVARPMCIVVEYQYTTKFCKLLSDGLPVRRTFGFYTMFKEKLIGKPRSQFEAVSHEFREEYCYGNETDKEMIVICQGKECGHPKVCAGCYVIGNMYSIDNKVIIEQQNETEVKICSEMETWTNVDPGMDNNLQLTCGEMQALDSSLRSGIYVNKFGDKLVCDVETDGGGWIVFQRRFDGSVDFNQNWHMYEYGFGNAENNGEFWLGLRPLTNILHNSKFAFEMRIELEAWDGERRFAMYKNFNLSDMTDKYRLSVGNYSGNMGDSLRDKHQLHTVNNGHPFSTYDVDNDAEPDGSCALKYRGGWWFNGCFNAHLNGPYQNNGYTVPEIGIIWKNWKGYDESMKRSSMKIREMAGISDKVV